jgi:hypothetical protein
MILRDVVWKARSQPLTLFSSSQHIPRNVARFMETATIISTRAIVSTGTDLAKGSGTGENLDSRRFPSAPNRQTLGCCGSGNVPVPVENRFVRILGVFVVHYSDLA